MIRVIASDMDGTLLNSNHQLDRETYETIMKAIDKGVRFIAATGRDYTGAHGTLGKWNIPCDYLVSSGAEIRDQNNNIVKSIPMKKDEVREVASAVKGLDMHIRYLARGVDYFIGTKERMLETAIAEIKLFNTFINDEEAIKSDIFAMRTARSRCRDSVEEVLMENDIYKVFMSSEDKSILDEAERRLSKLRGIVSASSFPTNIEVTNEDGQKGPSLKGYVESLGYTMNEVMVLGDSMNDYSMLSMDFGVTVAMENGDERIKKVADVIAPPNYENGAAWAMRKFCEL